MSLRRASRAKTTSTSLASTAVAEFTSLAPISP
jgi:hypothetical protein